jgi:hypothetical protein
MPILRPDGTVWTGYWRNQASGTDLHTPIDETSPDDGDYNVSSADPINDEFRVTVSNPGAGTITAVDPVRYRYWKTGPATVNIRVKLMQGTTQIAAWDHANISTTHTTAEQTLSGGELASISDFNALEIVVIANTASTIALSDNFDGSVVDTSKWTVTADTGTSAYQLDGRLRLKGPAASATGYVTLESVSTYDLTGKSAFVALRQIASRALFESVVETAPLSVTLNASNLLVWYISNGSLKARKRVSASNTDVYSVTYNTTTHRWFRIREASGSIYFDTAPSTASNPPIETDWVNRHTESNPFALTAIKVSLSTGAWSGPTADSGVAHFDGFNTAATTTGVLWRSTFEANNFSEWTENEGGTVSVSLDGGAVPGTEAVMAVQSSVKHSGTYAASTAIEAEVGNANPKCALFRNTEPTEQGETETFYSFWFYIPVRIDIDEPFGWQMLTEWQHTTGGLAWNQIDILNRGGVAGGNNYPTFIIHGSLGGGSYPADTGIDISVATWNHMEVRYKRGDGDGEVQAWLNGVEWLNETGLTLAAGGPDETNWGLMNYGELHESTSPTTIYYDDIIVSTTRVGYP